ncbi:hypothetical protein [Brevundimonas subvibrioides]|uniref:hypothetical protein n=1 Tax=Brevundimonas subvibrioides TaxID=74313 RepID=UPI0022B49399|nr:hypothetical protein [Brevundimonas subvibrioides]
MRTLDRFRILAAMGGMVVMAGSAAAQDAPAPQAETVEAPPAPAPTGPDWWIFSRSDQRGYLIDVNSIVRTGDELTVRIARVPRQGDPSDYSHTEDVFGIRCTARETHVDTSMDVFEDGAPTEPYATGEPWEAVRPDSLDEGALTIACDDRRPPGPSYPDIKAWIDAGRP